jgi:hypothetical protein
MSFQTRAATIALAITTLGAAAQGQNCPGLPALEPPKPEDCGQYKGITGVFKRMSCSSNNSALQARFERMSQGFATGLEYNSAGTLFGTPLDDAARVQTVDELRGCRGETVNLEFTPGNVRYLEYQLTAPSGVVISQNVYSTWTGDRILGPALTLPETGVYKLLTRTTAEPVTKAVADKKRGTQYVTTYPRRFRIGFRSDASVAALQLGDQVSVSATNTQPFIRRVMVKGGGKARFRLASQGTGDFSYVVLRESGEELARGNRTTYVEVPAVSPSADETFRVEARPFLPTASVGIQLTVVDDKAAGTMVATGSRVQSAFKLPAQFDSDNNPSHKSVYATETSRLTYRATRAERLAMTVHPSGATGLVMRVRVYDASTEDVVLDRRVTQPTPLSLALPHAGDWVIALAPVSATEMPQAGEAKYTVQFSAAGGAVTRAARTTQR